MIEKQEDLNKNNLPFGKKFRLKEENKIFQTMIQRNEEEKFDRLFRSYAPALKIEPLLWFIKKGAGTYLYEKLKKKIIPFLRKTFGVDTEVCTAHCAAEEAKYKGYFYQLN